MKKRLFIGVTGTIASGKGTIADYIEKKYGLKQITMSNFLRHILEKRNIKVTRDNLRKYNREIVNHYCRGTLSNCIIDRIKRENLTKVVIDGIRTPKDASILKKKLKAKIIFVEAPFEIRFKRIKKRNRKSDVKTIEEFRRQEKKEWETFNFAKTIKYADFRIDNRWPIKEVFREVDKIMKKII